MKGFHTRNLLVVEREMVSHSPSCPRFSILYAQEGEKHKKNRNCHLGKKEKSRWGDGVDDGAEASHESLWALLLYIQPGAALL